MFKIVLLCLIAWHTHADPLDYVDIFNVPNEDIETGYRLPNDTEPVRYDVTLTTHIHLGETAKGFSFDGTAYVSLRAKVATKIVTLHARQLTILGTQMYAVGDSARTWSARRITYDPVLEFLTFELDEVLTKNRMYILKIDYFGALRSLSGFYRSSYVDAEGTRRWLATTQFEPTDARHAFPCYDEPGVRAVYGITIVHGEELFAIGNTPVKVKKPASEPGYTITTFEDTPKMQTYLLAWVISDFSFVEVHATVPQRVFARRQAINSGLADFSVRAGVDILRALDDYVDMKYGKYNVKLDQISIPDFSAGAMENWGLVTYRESALLFDAKKDTWASKHSIASTIAHEYTHQYFGNLVSPAWWHYLWLNEGFANLYGYLLLTSTYPEFEDEDIFQISQLQGVMDVDAYGMTRAMTHYVESPSDVSRLFDNIAYPKSGSVLRMWLHALGESTWRKGLNYYLNDMELKAATSDDLARNLQKAVDEDHVGLSGLHTKHIVDNWSQTAGYPVLHVSMIEHGRLYFKQSQFLYSPDQPRNSPIWFIPVTIASATLANFTNTQAKFWIKDEEHTQEPVPSVDLEWEADDWIVVNLKQTGYYRVNYDDKLWDRIINKLNDHHTFQDIHHASRTALLNDAFNFARAEKLSYSIAFRLTEYLHHETHFAPWNSVSFELSYINRLLIDSPAHEWFNRYIQHLIAGLYGHYGVCDFGDSETWGDKRARETAITWACRSGYSTCREETKNLVLSSVEGSEIPPNLQSVVYCAGLRSASTNEFNAVWAKEREVDDVTLRTRILQGLGCVENELKQEEFLYSTLAVFSTYSNSQASSIINSMYSNSRSGLYSAVKFLTENAKAAQDKYGGLKTHASNIARFIASEALLENYKLMLAVFRTASIINAVEETAYLEIAGLNLKWVENNQDEILDFFKNALTSDGRRISTAGVLVTVLVAIAKIL